ncbi:MAG: hypothetical protein IKB75_07745 [Clostridia bacterium]|nr:hypothetical protein [Clostridia bacterium]
MIHPLKDSRTGKEAIYPTTVDITVGDGIITFLFEAKHSDFYCPYHGQYNALHSEGDVCEVFIGSSEDHLSYYEMEISPKGDLMLGKMRYRGEDGENGPIMDLDFVDDCFVTGHAELTEDGYRASFTFPLSAIKTGDGPIYFNAYRIDTDGGEMDKHLFALSPTMRPWFHTPTYFVNLEDYL